MDDDRSAVRYLVSADGENNSVSGLTMPGASLCRIVDCGPGMVPFYMPRSVDYAILIDGVIELLLDDGSVSVMNTPGRTR